MILDLHDFRRMVYGVMVWETIDYIDSMITSPQRLSNDNNQ